MHVHWAIGADLEGIEGELAVVFEPRGEETGRAVAPAKGGVRREESNGEMKMMDQLFVSVTFKKMAAASWYGHNGNIHANTKNKLI